MTITYNMIAACYAQGRKVFLGEITKADALEYLTSTKIGMKKSSAIYYLNAYFAMRNGECYKKTIKGMATFYFLSQILNDDGKDALRLALCSVQKHIDYYKTTNDGENLKSIQETHDEFMKIL